MSLINTVKNPSPTLTPQISGVFNIPDHVLQGSQLGTAGPRQAAQWVGETTSNVISDAATLPCRWGSIGGGIGGVRGGGVAPGDSWWRGKLKCFTQAVPQSTPNAPTTQAVTPSTLTLDAVTNREQDGINQETPQLPDEPCRGNEPTTETSVVSNENVDWRSPLTFVAGSVAGCFLGAVALDGACKLIKREGNTGLQVFKLAAGVVGVGAVASAATAAAGLVCGGMVVAGFAVGGGVRVAAHNNLCKRNYSAVNVDAESRNQEEATV